MAKDKLYLFNLALQYITLRFTETVRTACEKLGFFDSSFKMFTKGVFILP